MTKFPAYRQAGKLQINSNNQTMPGRLEFGYWLLFGYWCLVIGACSPLYMKTEVDDITVSDEIFLPFRTEKSFFFC